MDVLSNIPAFHFGLILGKKCQNVTMLRETYGVKISVTRPMNPEDHIQVFTPDFLPIDTQLQTVSWKRLFLFKWMSTSELAF